MSKKVKAQHGIICRLSNDPFGYFGWPSIARMDDGTMIVASSGLRREHVCPWGKTVLHYSTDDGYTWSDSKIINNSPLDDRDAGIVNLGGQKLLVTWFTCDPRGCQLYGSPEYLEKTRKLMDRWTDEMVSQYVGNWVMLSDDGGNTWSAPIRVTVTAPHGPVVLRSGDILFFGKEEAIKAVKSRDGGRTWTEIGTVPISADTHNSNYHEPHVVELPSGKLIGLIRYQHAGNYKSHNDFSIFQTESDDGGITWTTARPLGVDGSPPHVIYHSSGALVCVYGYRKEPYGERAMISYDEGVSWETDIVIREDGPDRDLGYPASVEMPDGSIYTIYYQKYAAGEKPSLLWSRWRLPRV
jgi:sialidase-1